MHFPIEVIDTKLGSEELYYKAVYLPYKFTRTDDPPCEARPEVDERNNYWTHQLYNFVPIDNPTYFQNSGLDASNDNPTIYLARGQTYEFVNNSGGSHPFQIRVSNGGSAYSVGVTNNGASSGTIKFEVPFASPNTLVYQCTSHGAMVGNIVVYPSI